MPRPAPPEGTRKLAANGYIIVRLSGHPRASVSGYVYEHVIVAERALGRHLPSCHSIHHVDEDTTNNTNGNLVICESEAYHKLLHARKRVADLGGNPDTQKICSICGEVLFLTAFVKDRTRKSGCYGTCKRCHAQRNNAAYHRRMGHVTNL